MFTVIVVRTADLLTSMSHPLCVSSCSLYHVIFRQVTDSYHLVSSAYSALQIV